jgi:hypothetical protein
MSSLWPDFLSKSRNVSIRGTPRAVIDQWHWYSNELRAGLIRKRRGHCCQMRGNSEEWGDLSEQIRALNFVAPNLWIRSYLGSEPLDVDHQRRETQWISRYGTSKRGLPIPQFPQALLGIESDAYSSIRRCAHHDREDGRFRERAWVAWKKWLVVSPTVPAVPPTVLD